jgi:hypothetical protein
VVFFAPPVAGAVDSLRVMSGSRGTSPVPGLMGGIVLLLILLALGYFLLPVAECPACIGWRSTGVPSRMVLQPDPDCRYCKGQGKSSLFKKWAITRKEGRPCYYMNHDE